jgi:hypothetical protein
MAFIHFQDSGLNIIHNLPTSVFEFPYATTHKSAGKLMHLMQRLQSIASCPDAFVSPEPFVWIFQKKTLALNAINA